MGEIPSVSDIAGAAADLRMTRRQNSARADLGQIVDQLPPHDLDSERAALACVLDCEQQQAKEYFTQLQEHHFYGQQNLEIFRALTMIEADGAEFNPVELSQRLKADGQLERIGGIDAITGLIVPSSANFPSYVAILEDRAARRRTIQAAHESIRKANDLKQTFHEATDRLVDRLAARIYSATAKPAEPAPRFCLGGVPICTPGNLTTISAQAKAGKSAAIGAMIASTISPDADCLGFTSENQHGLAVVHLDTEQCPFDHWELIQRALRRAHFDAVPPWLRSFCLTGFSAADVRGSIRASMEQAKRQFAGIHSVFVDGIADTAQDVNDPAETSELITELHKLAIEFDCPILNVIHVNPGSDFKTRGHLGSQLERKSETNLRLEKDGDGVTVIFADKNRRAPIPKTTAPRFQWSNEAGMHVAVASIGFTKESAMLGELREQCQETFSIAGKRALSWTDFVESTKRVPGVKSQRTAERIHGDAKREGIIVKNIIHQWELAT